MQGTAVHEAREPAVDDPDAHVEAVVRASGTSFFWGMRRLPPERRQAMYAIYAFCRDVDDIADGPASPEDKRARLGIWRGEIERLYGERPGHPVARALVRPVADYRLRKEDFRAVIDGMEMDADERVRLGDMDELELYCDRVAAAVGRLSVRVFGMPEQEGDDLAAALGQALQLTNILRDLAEDAARDRLYLPADLLRAHGIPADDADAVLRAGNLHLVCELLADIARRRFAEADRLIRAAERDQVRPAAMMMAVYRELLAELTARGWRDPHRRVQLPRWRKLWLAFRYGVL